jgi:hypothetical protein
MSTMQWTGTLIGEYNESSSVICSCIWKLQATSQMVENLSTHANITNKLKVLLPFIKDATTKMEWVA